jgi:hypothetical protein
MPCFVHREQGHDELLWGATYRITIQFLDAVFGFSEPSMSERPFVNYTLAKNYHTGLIT